MALLQPGLLLSFTAPEMHALLATPFLAESGSRRGHDDTLFPTMGIPAHPQLSILAKTWPRPAPQEPAARGSQPGDILPGNIHPGSAPISPPSPFLFSLLPKLRQGAAVALLLLRPASGPALHAGLISFQDSPHSTSNRLVPVPGTADHT